MDLHEEIASLVKDAKEEEDEGLVLTGPPVRRLNEFFSFRFGWQRYAVDVLTNQGDQMVEFEAFVALDTRTGEEFRFYMDAHDKAELRTKMEKLDTESEEQD
jgi:hypothetical protein